MMYLPRGHCRSHTELVLRYEGTSAVRRYVTRQPNAESHTEIVLRYEGTSMQIVLRLSACHPLKLVEIECLQRVGVSDSRWKIWQRSMSMMLLAQNGSISEALRQWKENVDKVFDGVEECPICYAVVHATTRHLPKLECKTCHNKFHSACLHKWFTSSQKSVCPLCQTAFH